ncbi:hypothetical protein SAMN05428954_6926 [Streptomyces sp. 2112.3]|nr:hypothetical protein BX261_0346 [Streptomyces sp. 2321.6]SDR58271.1 hypothetical protein SAMN05216511_6874 [Streptomyces sp. KS_16]SEB77590.1 hypothetical protein SAMN05428940_0346 [Streptomyces sp. 2133.1]SEF14214.1 hypothetical protein SAMN05428954_6926 [Streptomyces sp. 2112.3]SNC60798.1 hypothetical protein SAMN06272741_0347 [Streptomyces sp. 2114.4]
MRRGRHQRRRDLWRRRVSQQRAPTAFHAPRPVPSAPVAATPLRALYAAGSGIIDLAFARFQHWLWHPLI